MARCACCGQELREEALNTATDERFDDGRNAGFADQSADHRAYGPNFDALALMCEAASEHAWRSGAAAVEIAHVAQALAQSPDGEALIGYLTGDGWNAFVANADHGAALADKARDFTQPSFSGDLSILMARAEAYAHHEGRLVPTPYDWLQVLLSDAGDLHSAAFVSMRQAASSRADSDAPGLHFSETSDAVGYGSNDYERYATDYRGGFDISGEAGRQLDRDGMSAVTDAADQDALRWQTDIDADRFRAAPVGDPEDTSPVIVERRSDGEAHVIAALNALGARLAAMERQLADVERLARSSRQVSRDDWSDAAAAAGSRSRNAYTSGATSRFPSDVTGRSVSNAASTANQQARRHLSGSESGTGTGSGLGSGSGTGSGTGSGSGHGTGSGSGTGRGSGTARGRHRNGSRRRWRAAKRLANRVSRRRDGTLRTCTLRRKRAGLTGTERSGRSERTWSRSARGSRSDHHDRSRDNMRARDANDDDAHDDTLDETSADEGREKRFYLAIDDDVVRAPSIGQRTAERLNGVGIMTVRDLLACDAADVGRRTKNRFITADRVTAWQAQARLVCVVPWLRGTHAQLLVGAGYDTLEKLQAADAQSVCADVLAFCTTREGQSVLRSGAPPDMERIARWVSFADEAEPERVAA